MLLVGLTGAIGAGKSTVASLLAERGAVVIDADDLARLAVAPGSPGFAAVVAAFGPEAAMSNGELDRTWLADKVFADPDARRRLEAITHPEVARLFLERTKPFAATDAVVVYAVPLLVENDLQGMFGVVVTVEAPEDVRVARLVRDRGMTEEAAGARIAAQATETERRSVAAVVIANDDALDTLEAQVSALWRDLQDRAGTIER
ncbi:MAG TPA: dephospho-CoA kinase [Actinobacteria bacterium]|nr:dephospho-CoA kinase [Actinomycetota bacterium]